MVAQKTTTRTAAEADARIDRILEETAAAVKSLQDQAAALSELVRQARERGQS